MSQQLDDLRQTLVGRYEIVAEVGQGGFATVYSAKDLRHGSLVAIKVLRPELGAALGALRFTREIQITAQLQHPNILPLLDSGDVNGIPYYVMPFVEGESLDRRLQREGQLAIGDAVKLVAEIADGLSYAHARGFVHRDIKPENVLLSHGHAVLADFGVARALDVTGAERITDSGLALGTVTYMSPEQAAGERVDSRSDVYALGCVLYELLVGAPPFAGPTAQSVMARHAVDPPPSIRSVRPTVPAELEAAVLKAMAKVPTDRFATAGEFREEMLRAAAMPATAAPVARQGVRRLAGRVGAAVAAIAVIAAVVIWREGTGKSSLDPNRVVVFPLVVPGDWAGSKSAGEDVATMIGSAVDGAGPLRWIDAWQLLDASSRENIRTLTAQDAARLARAQRSAYTLTGRIAPRGRDSATVLLELRDVAGDSVVARPSATASVNDVWRAGLAATTQLLPRLITTGIPDVVSEWSQRAPAAVAHFLLAESAFRRVQLSEAEAQYLQAIAADSTFGLAAIRGAQAATWNHDQQGATTLIDVALRSRLSDRHRAFAQGYRAFLQGRADSAVLFLRRALALDSTRAFVWMQLGEVFAHLQPLYGETDSLEADALEQATRRDSTATNVLFHLIEVRLRQGDTLRAAPLVQRFLEAQPDTSLSHQVRIMNTCVRRGPAGSALGDAARHTPGPLLAAAVTMSTGARKWRCAQAAFEALLANDTAATVEADTRRWYALVGLQGLQLSVNDTAGAGRSIASFLQRWKIGTSLYLFDAAAWGLFGDQAARASEADARDVLSDPTACSAALRCWLYGVYLAKVGRVDQAAAIAPRILQAAGRSATHEDSVMAQSLEGHVQLARGDTSAAAATFERLLLSGRSIPSLEWDLAMPLAIERLALARVMIARGQPDSAIGVLDVIDSRAVVHAGFVATSLQLRAQAATQLHDDARGSRYRARLLELKQP
ncbi:MAG: protein kinase [Gemmatimonadaceae bacterium]